VSKRAENTKCFLQKTSQDRRRQKRKETAVRQGVVREDKAPGGKVEPDIGVAYRNRLIEQNPGGHGEKHGYVDGRQARS